MLLESTPDGRWMRIWSISASSASRPWVLGFGDILPLTPLARFLVYLEAIVGQFYIAVIVAILVGSCLATRRD